ncbi:hypothetical protein HK102_003092 [Quaeritorhiza haematococci]|nr:hypothetical protein HK102_003092 [Quaeritorhiza haematococci]
MIRLRPRERSKSPAPSNSKSSSKSKSASPTSHFVPPPRKYGVTKKPSSSLTVPVVFEDTASTSTNNTVPQQPNLPSNGFVPPTRASSRLSAVIDGDVSVNGDGTGGLEVPGVSYHNQRRASYAGQDGYFKHGGLEAGEGAAMRFSYHEPPTFHTTYARPTTPTLSLASNESSSATPAAAAPETASRSSMESTRSTSSTFIFRPRRMSSASTISTYSICVEDYSSSPTSSSFMEQHHHAHRTSPHMSHTLPTPPSSSGSTPHTGASPPRTRRSPSVLPRRETSLQKEKPVVALPKERTVSFERFLDQGQLCYYKKSFDDAILYWEHAVSVAVEHNDHIGEAKALSNMACLKRQLKQHDEARLLLERAWKRTIQYIAKMENGRVESNDSSKLWFEVVSRNIEIEPSTPSSLYPPSVTDLVESSPRTPTEEKLSDSPTSISGLSLKNFGGAGDINRGVPLFGPPHLVWIMQLTNNLGNASFSLGETENAMRWYSQCLRLSEAILNEFPLPTGWSWTDEHGPNTERKPADGNHSSATSSSEQAIPATAQHHHTNKERKMMSMSHLPTLPESSALSSTTPPPPPPRPVSASSVPSLLMRRSPPASEAPSPLAPTTTSAPSSSSLTHQTSSESPSPVLSISTPAPDTSAHPSPSISSSSPPPSPSPSFTAKTSSSSLSTAELNRLHQQQRRRYSDPSSPSTTAPPRLSTSHSTLVIMHKPGGL